MYVYLFIFMSLEQRFVIKYLLRKETKPKDIIAELQQVYGEDAYSPASTYFWIKEIKLGRGDLHTIPSPGRTPDEQIDDLILRELNFDPFITARMISRKAHCAHSTILSHLIDSLHMKNIHLRWIPHQLNALHKSVRVEISRTILCYLDKAKKNNFKFILTGDECWFEYRYNYKRMWVFDFDERQDIVSPSDIQKKTMVTIFFNADGVQLIDVKPKGIKINSDYFINMILQKLADLDVVKKAKNQKQQMLLHFDNAPSHNAKVVESFIAKTTFERIPHPPYSPDLAPSDFGLFGTVKDYFKGREFESEEELLSAINEFLTSKSKQFFKSLFENWEKRLKRCIELDGDYVI